MAQGNFQACLDVVLAEEGGFVDDPADPGAATNLGVTQASWQTWVGKNRPVTVADIRALTVSDVTPLYEQVFWGGTHAAYLPAGVDLATFDWAVNSGVRRGNQGLQEALGVAQDGLVGPTTINAASASPAADVINKICDCRAAFYKSLPQDEFARFEGGWMHRVEAVRAAALKMAAEAPAPTPT
jgi:lysozyme family protein